MSTICLFGTCESCGLTQYRQGPCSRCGGPVSQGGMRAYQAKQEAMRRELGLNLLPSSGSIQAAPSAQLVLEELFEAGFAAGATSPSSENGRANRDQAVKDAIGEIPFVLQEPYAWDVLYSDDGRRAHIVFDVESAVRYSKMAYHVFPLYRGSLLKVK